MARFDNLTVLAVNERTLANRWATLQRRINSIWTFSASGDVSENMGWSSPPGYRLPLHYATRHTIWQLA
jgi:hypothetical protein